MHQTVHNILYMFYSETSAHAFQQYNSRPVESTRGPISCQVHHCEAVQTVKQYEVFKPKQTEQEEENPWNYKQPNAGSRSHCVQLL